MHGLEKSMKTVSRRQKAIIRHEIDKFNYGENFARHMTPIYMIIMHDKFDFGTKKLINLGNAIIAMRKKWQDDNDDTVTNYTLQVYCKSKGIDVPAFVKSIPFRNKLFMAGVKKRAPVGCQNNITYGFMATLYLTIAILKETYRFLNKKIEEFMEWVRVYINLYCTKEPGTKQYYCDDNRIRLALIEDIGIDIFTGEKVENT